MLNELISDYSGDGVTPTTLIAAGQKLDLTKYKSNIIGDVAYDLQSQIEYSHPGDTITYSWEDPDYGTQTIEITLPTA